MSETTEAFRAKIAEVRRTGDRDTEMLLREIVANTAKSGPARTVIAMAEVCVTCAEQDMAAGLIVPSHADEPGMN